MVEPGRYTPLRYGGLTWLNRTPEKPSRLLMHEFAAAIEALQQRSWQFELLVAMTGKTVAQVTCSPNRVATATDTDPMAAVVRATVFALSVQLRKNPTDLPLVLAIAFPGLLATDGDEARRSTTPN